MEFAAELRRALKKRIGDERFDLWFRDVAIQTDKTSVHVFTATSFQLERIRKNFQNAIAAAAQDLGVNASTTIRFQVEPAAEKLAAMLVDRPTPAESSNDMQPAESLAAADPTSPADVDSQASSPEPPSVRLRASSAQQRRRRFQTMATFVQGACNHIASTSAQMVLQQPGDISPLVIHGSTGVGKTHLAEAIWCEAKKRSQRSRVLYLSAEQYTTFFLDALRGGQGLPAFRRKYRQADLLIIDDIQFFAGKQATLVEFAYTIDELARANRQLILTADRPAAQLSKLGPEIVNRLAGGLVCAMKAIDSETMEQISRQWAKQRNIVLPEALHGFLAGKMHGDARQLSGVLNRLQATHLATGEPITQGMAQEVLFELVPSPSRIIRLQDVRKAICETFNLHIDSLQAANRSKSVAAPRMLAMWLARRHTGAGLHEISTFFGRRSHSSAVTPRKRLSTSGLPRDPKLKSTDIRATYVTWLVKLRRN